MICEAQSRPAQTRPPSIAQKTSQTIRTSDLQKKTSKKTEASNGLRRLHNQPSAVQTPIKTAANSNYTDVVDTIREFMRRGIIIKTVINGMMFDGSTTDPIRSIPWPG
jgi:hypothetical protein